MYPFIGRDKIMKGNYPKENVIKSSLYLFDIYLLGLEQGIHGMCTGEVRRLLIPADLGKNII